MPLPKEWREFIELLNCHEVEYLVVGATALAYHGIPRFTGDLDILVRSTPDNAQRVERLLRDFGFAQLGLTAQDFTNSYQVVQLGVAPLRIDLLTSLSGVTFEEAWAGRVSVVVDGVRVNMLGRKELIENKKVTRRPQDLADLNALGEKLEDS
jgi:predicted nucleotidyltransferase